MRLQTVFEDEEAPYKPQYCNDIRGDFSQVTSRVQVKNMKDCSMFHRPFIWP